jgi:hypothetical protein
MLIQISDVALLGDLSAHFYRSGFIVEQAGGTMVRVTRPDAPDPSQERREIDLHLAVWRATNPGARAEIVE